MTEDQERLPYEQEEEVDGLPVLAEVRPLQPTLPAVLPTVQAAAVAATGFVAGAATVALMMRRNARRLSRAQAAFRPSDAFPITGSRTFLVHIHTLGRPLD
jgi:hypothetical protein